MPELFAILAQTTHHMIHFISGARHYVILLTVKSPAAYVDSHWSMKLTWYFLQSADTCWSTIHHCIVERNLRILRMCKTILRLRKFSDCVEHIHVVSDSQWFMVHNHPSPRMGGIENVGSLHSSLLAGTRHAILCMHDWTQCAGSHWELACVLGLMCRIPLGTAPRFTPHTGQTLHSDLLLSDG